MIRACLILLLLTLTSTTHSQTLYLGKLSKHLNAQDYRESHSLFIYENDQVLIGYWRNSYDKNTFALGYQYPIQQTIYFQYGIRAGFVSGYRVPVFATLYLDHQNLSCDITYPVIACGLRFSF